MQSEFSKKFESKFIPNCEQDSRRISGRNVVGVTRKFRLHFTANSRPNLDGLLTRNQAQLLEEFKGNRSRSLYRILTEMWTYFKSGLEQENRWKLWNWINVRHDRMISYGHLGWAVDRILIKLLVDMMSE